MDESRLMDIWLSSALLIVLPQLAAYSFSYRLSAINGQDYASLSLYRRYGIWMLASYFLPFKLGEPFGWAILKNHFGSQPSLQNKRFIGYRLLDLSYSTLLFSLSILIFCPINEDLVDLFFAIIGANIFLFCFVMIYFSNDDFFSLFNAILMGIEALCLFLSIILIVSISFDLSFDSKFFEILGVLFIGGFTSFLNVFGFNLGDIFIYINYSDFFGQSILAENLFLSKALNFSIGFSIIFFSYILIIFGFSRDR